MCLDAEPRIERQVVTLQIQRRRIEVLRGQSDSRHRFERCILLTPLNTGVFDRHVLVRILALDLQGETRGHPIRRQLLVQCAAQEIRQVVILFGQRIRRAIVRIRRDAELRIGLAELVGRYRKIGGRGRTVRRR